MAAGGDRFNVRLKPAHLSWGTLGNSRTNGKRSPLEAYVQIPLSNARLFSIYSGTIFNGRTNDGFFNTQVRASGSAGDNLIYAKQFQGSGNLKLFGFWFQYINAKPGDIIQVEFTSPSDVLFTRI